MSLIPFSVAMSVYSKDNPLHLKEALISITDDQTVKPDEIVLVVDGPINNELESVISFFDKKCNLKVIKLLCNKGLGNALRVASENCSHSLIARMDSDDISLPYRFEQQIKMFIDNPNLDVLGGNISEFFDNKNNIVDYRNVPKTNIEIKKYLKKRCPFNHVSVMLKKEALFKSGGYLDWHFNEDYYLWIRMFEAKCVFMNTGTVLVNVRASKDQFKRRGGFNYFRSEYLLQKYMFKKRIIHFPRFITNVIKRFLVQCLCTNSLRAFIYKSFARNKKEKNSNNIGY